MKNSVVLRCAVILLARSSAAQVGRRSDSVASSFLLLPSDVIFLCPCLVVMICQWRIANAT